MNRKNGKILGLLLGISLLGSVSASAVGPQWMDATHIFEADVAKLVDNVKLETIKEHAKRVKAPAPDVKKYSVGDKEVFWTKNIQENKFEQTPAILKAIGKHCYVFVEESKSLTNDAIEKIQKEFDEKIYPVNTSSFGFEWKPGIDGDERITLLMFDIKDGYNGSGGFVGGYFFAGDEYMQSQIPPNVDVKSNEREMFYLDINPSDPTKDHYMAVVAHEFQHMIHFNHDPKENTWVNEACSQIAPYLCGFGHASQISSYMKTPDNSLTAWAKDQMLANYGQVYLWNYYIFNRFLDSDNSKAGVFFKKLVDSKKQGIDGYSAALKEFKAKFTDTFDKFAITNFINDPKLAENNLYNYDRTLGRLKLPVTEEIRAFPGKVQNNVFLWSSDCIDVDLSAAKEEVEIIFGGTKAKFPEGKYNSFTVAAVLKNSREKVKPFVRFLEISPIEGKNLQAGSLKFQIEKDYDTLKLVIIAHAPEGIPDKAYAKAPAMKYFVQFKDKGEQVERIAAAVDSMQLLRDYSRTSANLDSSNEVAMNIALTNLESMSYKFSDQVKLDLENGKVDSVKALVNGIESGELSADSIRPLLKQTRSVGEFHLQQNQSFAELEALLEAIKAY